MPLELVRGRSGQRQLRVKDRVAGQLARELRGGAATLPRKVLRVLAGAG